MIWKTKEGLCHKRSDPSCEVIEMGLDKAVSRLRTQGREVVWKWKSNAMR